MPVYEYRCPKCGKLTERFYTSFASASNASSVACQCGALSLRVPSVPLKPHLYGRPDGYHHPSPTKRFSTKVASEIDGNKYTDG